MRNKKMKFVCCALCGLVAFGAAATLKGAMAEEQPPA